MDARRFEAVGRIDSREPLPPDGVRLRSGAVVCEVAISADACVRVRMATDALPPDASEALGYAPWRPAIATAYETEDGALALAAAGPLGATSVEIDRADLSLRVRDRSGRGIAALSDFAFAGDGRARCALAAPLGQQFHGFGEKTGPLDLRGHALRMWNRDASVTETRDPLYASIPFFIAWQPPSALGDASVATGFFLDGHAASNFDVAKRDRTRVAIETRAGGLDLVIIPGPRPADVLRRMSARLGRAPLPPRWALGHHQSRWSYGSERAVRAVARALRARGFPTDAIHLDIDHMHGFRVFTFDPRRFPDPPRLLRELRADGFHTVAIVDPGVKIDPAFPLYREGLAGDAFCRDADGRLPPHRVWPGDVALPDFQRPDVRAWWGTAQRALLDAGVAGIWNDMNEPAGWRRDLRIGRLLLPLRPQDLGSIRQAATTDPSQRVPHAFVRNLYGLQHARASREGLERARPRERAFVLTRSGAAGIQRHAALWTGDTFSRWPQLALSLRMVLRLSLSGVAFCGADIGGFAGRCTPELFARWMQLGALYPFARTHATWCKRRQEPWRFGPRVERIAREALRLRMRLLPYLQDLFHQHAADGAPIWRPLFFEFPDDPGCARVEDAFLLGPSLLVAPVLERGARHRELVLPPGVWIAIDDDVRLLGPARVRVEAPLERIPIFARGGTILPTQSPVLHAGERPAEPLVLEVFPGADGEHVLHEDDGATTAHREGAVARTALRVLDRAGGRLRLEIAARRGGFEIAPRPVRVVFHAASSARVVRLDAVEVADDAGLPSVRRNGSRIELRFEDDGRSRSVELEPAP